MVWRSTFLCLAALISLAGCSDSSSTTPEPGTDGWPCPNDNNCIGGRRCIDGTCQQPVNDVGVRPDAAIDAGIVVDAGPVDAGPEDAGDPCPNPATLTYIQTNIFGANGQAHCNQAACHGVAAAGNLSLLPGPALHADLLGPTRDGQAPEANLVVPSSPDTSRLYVIMRDRAPEGQGGPMPPVAPVPFCDLETVRRWIAEGALDN